jgi:predicted metal-binding membrane protein
MFLEGWVLMTLVAMVPSTLPVARLLTRARGVAHAALFLGVFVAVWIAGGAAAYVALTPFAPAVRWVGAGAVLGAAALYELTPLKDACLRRCRAPLGVLLRPTARGAVAYAADCAGCCAFLMALMLALGLMGLGWTLVLALVVFAQKVAPLGERSPRALALLLGTGAVATSL